MKKKISLCLICCALLTSLLSGCANYDDITASLDNVTITNTLPKVSEDASYRYLEEIDELVYEQQLNACTMYADSYKETYYQQFEDGERKSDRIAYMCTEKRNDINTEIEIAYAVNIYRLLQDVTDCSNPDAYVVKTHKDVLDFYDLYDEYVNGDDPQQTLIDILLEYYERSNILAFTFLGENDTRVFQAALAKIEENASTEEEFRFYVNENNNIITALNEVYGGVPSEYADKMSELNTALAEKLLMSLDGITEEERLKLLEQLYPSSPSPSPSAIPSALPSSSAAPSATMPPLATRIPSTAAPSATTRPTATPRPTTAPTIRPIPTAEPEPDPTATPRPAATDAPEPTPYEPIFGLDDQGSSESDSGDEDMYEFN